MRLGAGEILLTSMDRDGTRDGYDCALTRAVADAVNVPVIASGGVGTLQHLVDGVVDGGADAVLAASIFHFGEHTVAEAKAVMAAAGITVRRRAERARAPRSRRPAQRSTKATARSATTPVAPARKWSAIGTTSTVVASPRRPRPRAWRRAA